jgi:hypothetical protein
MQVSDAIAIEVSGHSGGEAALYRLFQEALTSAVKHRKVRNVWIPAGGQKYMLFCSLGTATVSLIPARYVRHLAGRASRNG